MRKYILLILFTLVSFSNLQAQNGWQSYNVPSPGGQIIHFGNANTGIILSPNLPNYLRTTDAGNSWITFLKPDTSFQKTYSLVYFANSQTVFAGGSLYSGPLTGGFLFKSTDGGQTWGSAINVYSLTDIQFVNELTGYIATGNVPTFVTWGNISKSTNGGNSWSVLSIEDEIFFSDVSFINPETGWVHGHYGDDVGTYVDKIYKTTNGGTNFATVISDSSSPVNDNRYRKIQFFDDSTGYLLRGFFDNVTLRKTTNGGISWNIIDTNHFTGNRIRNFFFLNKDTGWVTTGYTGIIFRTNNGGGNWTIQNTGQPNVYGQIYFHDDLHGWAMANSSTLLKTTTGGITAISNISTEIPGRYSLHQNYPNPFNPTTSIRFEIPSSVRGEKVKLSVYDISGKEVGVLVNSELQPGVYEYNFDGSGLGSGVYFYKLQSGDFIQTRRMVLVK